MTRSLRPGEPWGGETGAEPDGEVDGDDALLASTVAGARADPLVRFVTKPYRTEDLIATLRQMDVAPLSEATSPSG